jgi:hypothetical protein
MPLAPDNIVILHGGNAVQLRPSLRAAYRLHAKHGVDNLFAGIADGRLGVILDILAEGGVSNPPCVADSRAGLRDILAAWTKPLIQFLGICFGAEDDQRPASKATPTKPADMESGLISLFEIGTGWLGWTPTETWAATPAEILAAQRGHIAKLKAIYGSADQDDKQSSPSVYSAERLVEIEALGHDPEFDRAGFTALKAKIARGG